MDYRHAQEKVYFKNILANHQLGLCFNESNISLRLYQQTYENIRFFKTTALISVYFREDIFLSFLGGWGQFCP